MSVRKWNIETSTRDLYESNMCALCRRFLGQTCVDCKVIGPNSLEQSVKECVSTCRETLFTLLLCRKQKTSLFFNLNLDVLQLIFNYVCASVDCQELRCLLVTVCQNGHIYHEHCWARWSLHHNVCPEDNMHRWYRGERFARVTKKLKCEVVSRVAVCNEF